jgi:hypothetical protein
MKKQLSEAIDCGHAPPIIVDARSSKQCSHNELELIKDENVHTICYRCKKCGHLLFL